jgi:autotransporter-associated beta strand protein
VTNNATLQFNRSDSVGVPNDIHGTGSVVLNSGNITPSSTNNDYTGSTTLNSGILYAANATSLGATNSGTTVTSGAQLYITGNVDFGAESLSIAGAGGDSNGALRKGGAGATTYSGLVTMSTDSTIGVDTGATLTLSNQLSGTAALTKIGNGTLILSSSNSYNGITTVNGGGLTLNNSNALGASTQVNVSSTTGGALGGTRITLGAGVNISSSVALSLPCAGTTVRSCLFAAGVSGWAGPITLNGDGTPSPGDQIAFASAGGFMTIGGSITGVSFPGTLQLRGDGTGSGSAAGATNGYGGLITGNVALGDNATLQVHDGTTWTIASTGNNWSISEIAKGTLRAGANNSLPTAPSSSSARWATPRST